MLNAIKSLTDMYGLWTGIAIGEFILLIIMYQRTVPRDVYTGVCEEKTELVKALNSLGPTTDKLFEFVKLLVAREGG